MSDARATVLYCGEAFDVQSPDRGVMIGRGGDISLDETNLSLHRRFLILYYSQKTWWLRNTGSILTAELSDGEQRVKTLLRPGGCVPLSTSVTVRLTAGRTTYEFLVRLDDVGTLPAHVSTGGDDLGSAPTIRRIGLTDLQRLLVLALAEPTLSNPRPGGPRPPTNDEAIRRLGWSKRRYHKHLDAVCRKLADAGVSGVHGEPTDKAADRRVRLLEYAIATNLVTFGDLKVLDEPRPRDMASE